MLQRLHIAFAQVKASNMLLLNLRYGINLNRCDKYIALSNLRIYNTWKNIKM